MTMKQILDFRNVELYYDHVYALKGVSLEVNEGETVALIGASGERKKLGHYILKNLLESGFGWKIFPVNPKHAELMGVPCFRSVTEIPGDVDMVVIVTPAVTVPALAEECGKKKVKMLRARPTMRSLEYRVVTMRWI